MHRSPLVRFAQQLHMWPFDDRWRGPLLATIGVLIAGMQPSYLMLACGAILVPPKNWASLLIFSACLRGLLAPACATVAFWKYSFVFFASFLHFFLTEKTDRVQPHDDAAQMH